MLHNTVCQKISATLCERTSSTNIISFPTIAFNYLFFPCRWQLVDKLFLSSWTASHLLPIRQAPTFYSFYCIELWNCTQLFFFLGYKGVKCNHTEYLPINFQSINQHYLKSTSFIQILTTNGFKKTSAAGAKFTNSCTSESDVREDL